jgi:glucan phosphoethanolaminetransferase (alkaline phosphatase superfamily)
MKDCQYCGAQNDDSALQCGECGNPFPVESPGNGSAPALTSPLASEVATGAGILLILMAVFFAIGRIWGETGSRSAVVHKHDTLYSSFATTSTPAPFIALAAIYPVFVLCRARFGKSRAARPTVLISLLAGILSLLPGVAPVLVVIWCVPALLIVMASQSALGYYFGAALQLAFGVAMLVRSRPRSQEAAPNRR